MELSAEEKKRSSVLCLIPSQVELEVFQSVFAADKSSTQVELCGFGPIVAAARTAQLLASHNFTQVSLVGIAGRLCDELQIGEAHEFAQVACYGIGAGSGREFVTAEDMGWKQWPSSPEIGDHLTLGPKRVGHLLLTSCAASGSPEEANERLKKFPLAVAEDMEGFSVAAACKLFDIQLRIFRGMSNDAGDRNHQRWQVQEAMLAATKLMQKAVYGES